MHDEREERNAAPGLWENEAGVRVWGGLINFPHLAWPR